MKSKPIKTTMRTDDTLPTYYVNSVNIQAGLDDFFLTFGTAQPLNIQVDTDLSTIESIDAQALFRCAVSRSMMKQIIDLLTPLYATQTQQIEEFQSLQRRGEDYDHTSSDPSEL
ncbi:MAG: hypothetical protein ABI234_05015 [Ktedonobacteraceae bacterium]